MVHYRCRVDLLDLNRDNDDDDGAAAVGSLLEAHAMIPRHDAHDEDVHDVDENDAIYTDEVYSVVAKCCVEDEGSRRMAAAACALENEVMPSSSIHEVNVLAYESA
jgi:hypothetical protein